MKSSILLKVKSARLNGFQSIRMIMFLNLSGKVEEIIIFGSDILKLLPSIKKEEQKAYMF